MFALVQTYALMQNRERTLICNAEKQAKQMGRYRAIMTDTDRAYISGDGNPSESQRMQSVSRVRSRITEELPKDIEVLEEHHPELLEELRTIVCEDEE